MTQQRKKDMINLPKYCRNIPYTFSEEQQHNKGETVIEVSLIN